MTQVENCMFCMIVRGEVPARVVYEDDQVLAFDDIAPQAPVHTLIIPKNHYKNLSDNVPISDLCPLFLAVPKVAKLKGLEKSGYRVIVNNGVDANQTVAHLHVHLLGGRTMSHNMVNFPNG